MFFPYLPLPSVASVAPGWSSAWCGRARPAWRRAASGAPQGPRPATYHLKCNDDAIHKHDVPNVNSGFINHINCGGVPSK